jgi:hypothetical protein
MLASLRTSGDGAANERRMDNGRPLSLPGV